MTKSNFFVRHFPKSRAKFNLYFKAMFPIIFGSIFFAMNNFVDNFMVGGIDQGPAALGSANSWTGIYSGLLMGSSMSGSVILAQYYAKKDYVNAKAISNLRVLTCFISAVIFATIAFISPETLNSAFLKKPSNPTAYHDWRVAMDNANTYLRLIAISWFLLAFTFNYGNQMRELGHTKVPMYYSMATMTTNITLNSILIFGLNMGIEGAAYASIAARGVAFIWGYVYIYKHKLPVYLNPWDMLKINKTVSILYVKRWIPFLGAALNFAFVTFRNSFYDSGFPVGSIAKGVGAMLVLGLTGAIMNVFMTAFNALSSMAAIFVASELGKGNVKQAKINSDELKGFNTVISMGMSLILVCVSFTVPWMSFLSHAEGVDTAAHLKNVKESLFVIAFWYPIWIWFSTSFRNGLAGGKGNGFAICDFVTSGLQLPWAALVFYVIVPASPWLQDNFWAAYFIFFISDLSKMVWQEALYYRYKWLHVITKNTKSKKELIKESKN